MRISDWSSDVCSSDLEGEGPCHEPGIWATGWAHPETTEARHHAAGQRQCRRGEGCGLLGQHPNLTAAKAVHPVARRDGPRLSTTTLQSLRGRLNDWGYW